MIAKRSVVFTVVLVLAAALVGAEPFFAVLPPAEHDAAVPTLESVVGFAWGRHITDPDQVLTYARALAGAVPERVRLVEYARSLEGRPLLLLLVSSDKNIAQLDQIGAALQRLSDPRGLSADEAQRLVSTLPAVVWVACSIHGDETSGGDAGLALAYHLAAGSSPEVSEILDRDIVVIDPMQNPDGRARFVASTRAARGIDADDEPASAEHSQPWPGGRFSHDLFDLNRDWFALTHPETAGRVAEMLKWHPVVVMDLHEMGSESGFYFAPPAVPKNPLVSDEQASLWQVVGRANAAAFDAHGWRYWTREVFDSFYPGYSESWPFFSGVVGMTYEQASSRGLVVKLEGDGDLTYAAAVQHHLTASFTTCRTVAENHDRFLHSWFTYRRTAVEEGRRGPQRAYLLEGGTAPRRTAALAELLARQGIEVSRVTADRGDLRTGDFVVPLDQPLGRLVRTLLEKNVPMGEAFEKEQERRWEKRLPDEIYDITAWSLPLLWQVPVRALAEVPPGLASERVQPGWVPEVVAPAAAKVAYLLPWRSIAAARTVAGLLREGVVMRVATKPFTLQERHFDSGTVVIRRGENGVDLPAKVAEAGRRNGVEIFAADTGYADEGIDLGSDNVKRIKAPSVALLWDTPTDPTSVGGTRYALERAMGYPVTVVRSRGFAYADLSHFDVIILPEAGRRGGGWAGLFGERGVERIKAWVENGGVLIGIGDGASFLCGEKVGLLHSSLEKLGGAGAEKGKQEAERKTPAGRYEEEVKPDEEEPPMVPGAIVKIDLDTEDVLAAGFPGGKVNALANSRRIFTPLKLDQGTNVGVYAPAGQLLESGFMFKESREQLPRKAFLMEEGHGRGRVIAFAEEPSFRGFTGATMLLLANAVFFGPAM
jgi:hypothetical protein